MLVPLRRKAFVALLLATLNVPFVPLSTRERRVLAVGVLVSLMVNVPLELLAPNVTTGDVALKASGLLPESVTVPLAAIVVAPEMAPVLVIPPLLLFKPLLIEAPLVTVTPPFNVCNAEKVWA